MIKPLVPKNEKKRMQALLELGILDSNAEKRFDQLTRLAANFFNVKICLVSLVDEDRQWFKSKFGLDACETNREISFCAHTILQNEIMVVSDARNDSRFKSNPLVLGQPHIVFYAGVPLTTLSGYKIGSLCIIDDKPRNLDSSQLEALRDFASIIEREINSLSEKKLQQIQEQATTRTELMLAALPDIVFIIQNDYRYLASNDHQDLYLPKQQFMGKSVAEVLPHDIAKIFEHSLSKAFETDELITFNYELLIKDISNSFEAKAKRISETEAVVVVRNTTQEQARLNDLERLSMVAEQTTNAVIITDCGQKTIWVNHAFTTITGYSLEEIKGKVPGKLLQRPETDLETVQTIREALQQEKSYSVEIINHRKDGSPYWVRIVCNPWRNELGEIKGFIAIQSEITQEKQNLEKIRQSQSLLTAVIDANKIGTWVLNLQTGSLVINENWANLIGYTLDELEPVNIETWQDLTHPVDLQKCMQMLDDYDKGVIDYYEAPIRMKHKAGHWVWIRTRGNITSRTCDGKAEYSLGTHLDINAQMLAEEHLQEQYEYMQLIFDKMIDGVVIIDSAYKVQSFNPTAELIFGYSTKEVLDQPFEKLIPKIDITHSSGQLQYSEGKRKNGDVFPMEIGIVESKHDQQTIYVAMFRDVTERKTAEEEIHKLAYFDVLTGLPNRRLMFDRLQHALLKSDRYKRHLAILFIDFDNFKQINDSAGHDFGDLLLQEIAVRLCKCVRDSDTVARLGGDEFIVIIEDLDPSLDTALAEAESAAEKIKYQLTMPYQLQNISYIGTSSIGITLTNDSSLSPTEFLKQADLAMYQAKQTGKNAMRFFALEMQEKVSARIQLEQDLRNAIANEEFEVFLQTQVDENLRCVGAEGLVRWRHPQRGLIPPIEFIPFAEESGLMVPIGRLVLKHACLCLARWAHNPLMSDLILAINISVVELNQNDWVESILKIIEETGANPTRLKLEITESVMASEITSVVTKLSLLRDKGIAISLDDFGTGYSSLTYLKSLPLNQLKIDQSFVRNILVDHEDYAIAETIINLASIMRLSVIAEGVETQEQLGLLKDMGCKVFQGYLFGRPEPIEKFEDNLKLQKSISNSA